MNMLALVALCFAAARGMVVIPDDDLLRLVQAPPSRETVSEKRGDGQVFAPCSRDDVQAAVTVIRESQDFTCESAFLQVKHPPYAAPTAAVHLQPHSAIYLLSICTADHEPQDHFRARQVLQFVRAQRLPRGE
jgi:hypothetical protein